MAPRYSTIQGRVSIVNSGDRSEAFLSSSSTAAQAAAGHAEDLEVSNNLLTTCLLSLELYLLSSTNHVQRIVLDTQPARWASSTIRCPLPCEVSPGSAFDLTARNVLTILTGECKKTASILASFVDPRQSFGPDKIIPPAVLAKAKVGDHAS